MKEFKLSIDLLPKGAWGNDLSKTLPQKDWDTLRRICYEKAKSTCQICGYKTEDLDAHEVWEFDIERKTQTLKDIIALCSKCHGVKHFRNSVRLGYGENAKNHFVKINRCSLLDFASHCIDSEIAFEERNKVYRWEMKADLEKFGGKGMNAEQKKIPMIENPYESINWDTVKFFDKQSLFTFWENQEAIGPPVVRSIQVDNYQGTLIVRSLYSNKIEWLLDGTLVKTNFNVSKEFKTEFKVEGLTGSELSFTLIGEGGTLKSKVFSLQLC